MNGTFIVVFLSTFACTYACTYLYAHQPPWHTTFPTTGLQDLSSYPFLPHFFTLHHLAGQQGRGCRIVLIDTGLDEYHYNHMLSSLTAPPEICDGSTKPFITFSDLPLTFKSLQQASHATHAYSLIKGTYGLAPNATCIVLKTFTLAGLSTQAALLNALSIASKLNPDVLLVALKFHDTHDSTSPSTQLITSCLRSFPYVVAAAGNDRAFTLHIAYPACLASTIPHLFSVGAFGFDKKCSVAPFSQVNQNSSAELISGPTFLMPGISIEGASIASKNGTARLRLTGTSCAAALYAGYLALVLGEFKDQFLPEQITAVLKASCLYPYENDTWLSATDCGIPDMRLGLFLLHLLLYMRPFLPYFDREFEFILESAKQYLFHHTRSTHFSSYSPTQALGSSLPTFEYNFMEYILQSQAQAKLGIIHPLLKDFSKHKLTTLSNALNYCAASLIPHLQSHLLTHFHHCSTFTPEHKLIPNREPNTGVATTGSASQGRGSLRILNI